MVQHSVPVLEVEITAPPELQLLEEVSVLDIESDMENPRLSGCVEGVGGYTARISASHN